MLLSCGDSLYDMFVSSASASPTDDTDTNVTVTGVVGGSPMNVALGAARLGHLSYYLTKISSDVFGNRITRFLKQNMINISLSPPTDLNTSLAMVETQSDGSAHYAFYIEATADVSLEQHELPATLPDAIRIVHFASYSTVIEPVATSLRALATRESDSRLISYDPNLRLSIQPDIQIWREAYDVFSRCANIVKASDEDIASLFGQNGEDDFVADCLSKGAELVYITRGSKGGSAFNAAGKSAHAAGISVKAVDTVGAGDSFQAALLHWFIKNGHVDGSTTLVGEVNLQASLDFAIRASAITCSRRGANLPTLEDIDL